MLTRMQAGVATVALSALSCGLLVAHTMPASATTTDSSLDLQADDADRFTSSNMTAEVSDDGTIKLQVYGSPVNYQDADGSWIPIDNTLVPSELPGVAFENAANDHKILIPEDPSSQPVEMVTTEGSIALRMRGVSDTAVEVDANTTRFSEVRDASSVEYEVTSTGIKESILLSAPPELNAVYNYVLDMSANLTPSVMNDGGIAIQDETGEQIAVIPPGNMFDSSGAADSLSYDVPFTLEKRDGYWALQVRPNRDWLTDPSRVYPVTVDPTLAYAGGSVRTDCWLNEARPSNASCGQNSLRIRAGQSSPSARNRGLVSFDTHTIPSYFKIASAEVGLYLDASKSLNGLSANYSMFRPGKVFDGTASWGSAGATGGWVGGSPAGVATGTRAIAGGTSGYKTFDVTPIVTGWLNGTFAQTGLLLKQTGDDVNNVLQFYSSSSSNDQSVLPYLRIDGTLGTVAPAQDAPSCDEAYSTSGSDPSFLAKYAETESTAMSTETVASKTATAAQARPTEEYNDSVEDSADATSAAKTCTAARICILGFGHCGWEVVRLSSKAVVHISYGIQDKINNVHGVPDWLISRSVALGHRTTSFQADGNRVAYRFTVWEWECNSKCVRMDRYQNVDFVIDWNDGKKGHGFLVTLFCRDQRPCPAWVQDDPPYFGPPGLQLP